jgi:hypothetical protein
VTIKYEETNENKPASSLVNDLKINAVVAKEIIAPNPCKITDKIKSEPILIFFNDLKIMFK